MCQKWCKHAEVTVRVLIHVRLAMIRSLPTGKRFAKSALHAASQWESETGIGLQKMVETKLTSSVLDSPTEVGLGDSQSRTFAEREKRWKWTLWWSPACFRNRWSKLYSPVICLAVS